MRKRWVTELDRRPIRARTFALSNKAAAWLAARRVSPNTISLVGLFSGVLSGIAFASSSYFSCWPWILGAFFILVRLTCNMLDGMVAVLLNIPSPLGEIYNDAPDRVSDCSTLIGFGFALGSDPLLGMLAALAAVFTAYVRVLGKSVGTKSEFCGPMAKQQRMALIALSSLFLAFGIGQAWAFRLPVIVLVVITVGSFFTGARRLLRIARQLR